MAADLPNPKLLSLRKAVGLRTELGEADRRLVLTNGVFDLLHTGHLHFLQQARALGDALLVAINSDASVRALKGPRRPVQSEIERAYALAATWFVDGIVIFDQPRLTPEIRALRPDIYCKAGDYTLETLDPEERQALEDAGARLEFLPYLSGFSTTELIAKINAAGSLPPRDGS